MSDRERCLDCLYMQELNHQNQDSCSCIFNVPDWALPPPILSKSEWRTCPAFYPVKTIPLIEI